MLENNQRKTVDDYQNLPEGAPLELIHGEFVLSPSPNFYHQDIVSTLLVLLWQFVKQHDLGKVVTAPMDVYLSEQDVLQPDILFIAKDRLHIVRDRIMGAPDLVIEILSPSNAQNDLWTKRLIYEAAGIKEYWIVDPDTKRVELSENIEGRFVRFTEAEKQGRVESKVLPGFAFDVSAIF